MAWSCPECRDNRVVVVTGVSVSPLVHVNMWSEHYGRVMEVAQLVEARSVPYRMTLDHSHVIFKIDNPEEQEVLDMRPDVESGKVVLDWGVD